MFFCIILALVTLISLSSETPVENGDFVTDIKSFPYVVHILVTFKNLKTKKLEDSGCGGVILKAGIVLTAAHCVHGKKKIVVEIKVTAGSIFRSDQFIGIPTRFAAGFRVHKDYTPEKVNLFSANLYLPNDIAMLWLKTPFSVNKPNSKLETAKLFLRDLPPNTIGTVVGWGQDERGEASEILKRTRLRKLSDEECRKHYGIGPHAFCATSLDQKCGVSLGDSGGPFVYEGLVIGLLSFGNLEDKEFEDGKIRTICDQMKPVVFGDIRMFRQWIGYSLDGEAPKAKCKKDQQKFCAL